MNHESPLFVQARFFSTRLVSVRPAILSGLMKGAAETRNRPAIADVLVGQGHVILFATNPCYR